MDYYVVCQKSRSNLFIQGKRYLVEGSELHAEFNDELNTDILMLPVDPQDSYATLKLLNEDFGTFYIESIT